MTSLRLLPPLAAAVLLWGCAPPRPPSPPPTPAVSFDGHYEGTVRGTAAAAGFTMQQCAPIPQLSLQVTNNSFTYVMQHPNVTNGAAGLPSDQTAVHYTAYIAPDGTLTGTNDSSDANIVGQVTGRQMSGQINGILCSYTFTANRV
jgi:hypothetical protein